MIPFPRLKVPALIGAFCFVCDLNVTTGHAQTFPSVTTKSGLVLSNITVTSIEPDGIRYQHADGLGKIALDDLPDPVAESLGYTKEQTEKMAAQRAAAEASRPAPRVDTRFAKMEAEIKDLKARALSGPTEMFQSGSSSAEVANFRKAAAQEIAGREKMLADLRKMIAAEEAKGASEKQTQRLIDAVVEKKVFVGMPAQFAWMAWGQPRDIDTTTSKHGQRQSWWYGGDRVLWIDGGVVESASH